MSEKSGYISIGRPVCLPNVIPSAHQVVFDSTAFISLFSFRRVISTLDFPDRSREPAVYREGLLYQPYAPHLPGRLRHGREWDVRKGCRLVLVCVCHKHGPTGLLLLCFFHLGGGSASQMAAMLMNLTGCYDTTASGMSK